MFLLQQARFGKSQELYSIALLSAVSAGYARAVRREANDLGAMVTRFELVEQLERRRRRILGGGAAFSAAALPAGSQRLRSDVSTRAVPEYLSIRILFMILTGK